jgi:hypothetical protein
VRRGAQPAPRVHGANPKARQPLQRRDLNKTQRAIVALELEAYHQERVAAATRKRANLGND